MGYWYVCMCLDMLFSGFVLDEGTKTKNVNIFKHIKILIMQTILIIIDWQYIYILIYRKTS